ncbi:MAG: hypothetical protein GXP45_06550 [bacterium]|nr:hypothetical protein [bacterium]
MKTKILLILLLFLGVLRGEADLASPDSLWRIKKNKIYKMENGKEKFKAYFLIRKYALDSTDVFQYLPLLFEHKGDTIELFRTEEYQVKMFSLYKRNLIYRASFTRGPIIKFYPPDVEGTGAFALVWAWVFFFPLMAMVFALLSLVVSGLLTHVFEEKQFGYYIGLNFWFSMIAMAFSQLVLQFLGVPETVAYELIMLPFVWMIVVEMIVWIVHMLVRRFKK